MRWARVPEMEIALHLGLHRTGSTALQQTLRRQRAMLEADGVVFWGPDQMRRPGFAGLASANTAGAEAALVSRARAELHQACNHARQIGRRMFLISEENIPGVILRNFSAARLYPDAGRKLAAFRARLPQPPARIVLALRDYAEYWPSAYAQALTNREMPPFEPDRLVEGTAVRGWPAVVGDIAAVFPEARITLWRHAGGRGGFRPVLAAVFGDTLARRLALADGGVNRALSRQALERLVQLRAAGNLPASGAARRQRMEELRAMGGAPFRPFIDDQAATLTRQFEADWAALSSGAVPAVEAIEAPRAGIAGAA